ncbi:MAG: insulinase family protein [Candidatus Latescibacteria bacterium]|nr:insulinase family protein [Candidatus Latescibacterota bacterium]
MGFIRALLAVAFLSWSCGPPPPAKLPAGITPLMQQRLPVDPQVKLGKLDNGLQYLIRANHRPESRAELRLVVRAGSVLEEEGQQGLAHVIEHMAFNGTAHFAKQELVDYLESIGMRFGPDLNAYTGFDETVYMLQVPTDSAGVMEKAFQILQDWAGGVTFAPDEVDQERGVVIEEWRGNRGAEARLLDLQLPVILKDSRYASRLPIGEQAVLDTFGREDLRRFYQQWYRPELMALVAVGDFDPAVVEELTHTYLGQLPASATAVSRPSYPVPDHEQPLFSINADPEATGSSVALYFKKDVDLHLTVGGYRRYLVEALYQGMLNRRLYELSVAEAPPFLAAYAGLDLLVRTKESYFMGATVADQGLERGLEALLTESRRVQLHGFTATELEREKKELLRGIEQTYRERDKSESDDFADEYLRYFLEDEPIPGIVYEYGIYQTFLPQIGLKEVEDLARTWEGERNLVVVVSLPEKAEVEVPAEEQLKAVFSRVKKKKIKPYQDQLAGAALLDSLPAPAPIVSTREIPELGLTAWQLGNGVGVVLKPTSFKNDEVLFAAYSPGGHSLVADSEYVAGVTADGVVKEGGVGRFSQVELLKLLAGKVVEVSPWIGGLEEGLSGRASPEDLETMFQLIYLYMTQPRRDSTAYAAYRGWLEGMLQNRNASPETALRDSLQVILAQHHYRARPWSQELLGEMDLGRSLRIYRDRFADASDFTFFLVGNFTLDQVRPLAERYLGGLPALGRRELWRDLGVELPKGVVERQVYKGIEPKSQTQVIFTGPFVWERQHIYDLHALASVLEIRLREVLREDLGGTYGVSVNASASHYPREEYHLAVGFGCAPQRVEELTRAVFAQLDSLKEGGPEQTYIDKIKEMQRRQREEDVQENSFWLEALESAYVHGTDPKLILQYDELVESLTPAAVQAAARQYVNEQNYVRVTLLPEGEGEDQNNIKQ